MKRGSDVETPDVPPLHWDLDIRLRSYLIACLRCARSRSARRGPLHAVYEPQTTFPAEFHVVDPRLPMESFENLAADVSMSYIINSTAYCLVRWEEG
jgi:hypothetical protein